jgi:hypothetical protein
MSSDFLRIIDEAPTKTLLLIAAGLVIACQLVAMVMVAGGQVEKAQLREATQASARAATVWCVESSTGAALKDCGRTESSFAAKAGSEAVNTTPYGFNLATLGSQY